MQKRVLVVFPDIFHVFPARATERFPCKFLGTRVTAVSVTWAQPEFQFLIRENALFLLEHDSGVDMTAKSSASRLFSLSDDRSR